jgi:hypothetical protein
MFVFRIERNKDRVEDIIKKNAYDELSVAKVGYNIKEIEINGEKRTYLIIEGNDEKIKEKAKELLSEFVKEVEGEETKKIIELVKEDDNNAVKGFGDIFG